MKCNLIDRSKSVIKIIIQSISIIKGWNYSRYARGSSWSRKVHPLEVDDNIHNTSREAL